VAFLPTQPHTRKLAGNKVLDENIRARHKLEQHIEPLWFFKVDLLRLQCRKPAIDERELTVMERLFRFTARK
jgi:hypothetical protein